MKYQRIEQRDGYQIITTVDILGNYEQFSKWHDGVITHYYKTTLLKMGWNDIKDFLREKRGFKKVS